MDNFLHTFAVACTKPSFLGLKPWYQYLPYSYNSHHQRCEVGFNVLGNGHNSSILLILLAIIDDLLIIAGFLAVGYVIYAGIKYVLSQGSPDETSKAQSTLVNALLGLAIAVVAIGLVSYLGGALGSSGLGKPSGTGVDITSLPNTPANTTTVKNLLTIVFSIVGALSLLFITIGGFRYVLSQGDPQATGKAKNTILYALVGLVIAVTAQIIVTFVIGKVT